MVRGGGAVVAKLRRRHSAARAAAYRRAVCLLRTRAAAALCLPAAAIARVGADSDADDACANSSPIHADPRALCTTDGEHGQFYDAGNDEQPDD